MVFVGPGVVADIHIRSLAKLLFGVVYGLEPSAFSMEVSTDLLLVCPRAQTLESSFTKNLSVALYLRRRASNSADILSTTSQFVSSNITLLNTTLTAVASSIHSRLAPGDGVETGRQSIRSGTRGKSRKTTGGSHSAKGT